jgi:hypothetical protein
MPSLSAADLFQPSPSGVGAYGLVPLNPPIDTWLGFMLQSAALVQLPTTSWQPGAPERTILAIEAVTFQSSDVQIALLAQGSFLQTSAGGSVAYTTTDGTTVIIPVTPDPSNPAQNPSGTLGWEDLLAQSVYGVTRLAATFAAGPLAIVNLGMSAGPYVAGGYHVENQQSSATYTNVDSLTIPSSAIAGSGGTIVGVTPGSLFTIFVTASAHGLAPGQSVYLNIPPSSGVSGLAGVFAIVVSASGTSFSVQVGSAGSFSGSVANGVYLCTVAQMVADVAGIASNAGPGQVTQAITQNANISVSNLIGWSGSNWESNQALATRATLSLASRSPNGPSQAYVYFADTATQLLAAQSGSTLNELGQPPYTLTNGPVTSNETANPQTGIVTTVVASSTPASTTLGNPVTPGVSQLPISAMTNANPCVVTCTGPTTLLPGGTMVVTLQGVTGMSDAFDSPVTYLASYTAADSFSIPVDTSALSAYVGGGQVEGGDLGQIDLLIQQNVVPSGTTAVTVSALALPVNVVATVSVPQALVSQYSLAVNAALQARVTAYPIGGVESDGSIVAIEYDDFVEALGIPAIINGVSYAQVQSLILTVGGTNVPPGGSIAFPDTTYQSVLAPPTVSVVGR